MEFLKDNPWIPLIVGVGLFVLWIDHVLKNKARDKIGTALERYANEENENFRFVWYPDNLKGSGGEVRAGSADKDECVTGYFTHKTWRLWHTLILLALVVVAVWFLLKEIGVL